MKRHPMFSRQKRHPALNGNERPQPKTLKQLALESRTARRLHRVRRLLGGGDAA